MCVAPLANSTYCDQFAIVFICSVTSKFRDEPQRSELWRKFDISGARRLGSFEFSAQRLLYHFISTYSPSPATTLLAGKSKNNRVWAYFPSQNMHPARLRIEPVSLYPSRLFSASNKNRSLYFSCPFASNQSSLFSISSSSAYTPARNSKFRS